MEQYEEKIKLARELLVYDQTLSDEEQDKRFDEADGLINELISSKNTTVLCELLDFFTQENEEYGGFCESMKSDICINYSLEQILEAFYKKFDTLIKNDIAMAVEMSMWFFESDMFEEFREMFNYVKSSDSNKFLDEFLIWWPDYQNQIDILKNDIKTWKAKK